MRLPEIEIKDLEDNKIELKFGEEVTQILAHKEETKKFWLKEINQYITDVVALQEHSIDDLKIDPKQHLDTAEPVIKLPQRIEAYEPDQNIKPSDFAEDYTISKYSTVKATEEIKSGTVSSTAESVKTIETVEATKLQKTTSKIPVLKKNSDEKVVQKTEVESVKDVETEKLKNTKTDDKVQENSKPEEKSAEKPKPEEKSAEKPKPVEKSSEKPKSDEKALEKPKPEEKPKIEEKVEVKSKENVEIPIETEKVLPELKVEIIKKTPVDLQPVVDTSIQKPVLKESLKENSEKPKEKVENKPQDPIKSELTEVEASVSEKLDKLSQKLRSIRKTETEKEITKFSPQEVKSTEEEKNEEELRKQEQIRDSIQEKIEEDYIAESSVIKRIEERYKRNYKDKDVKSISKRKESIENVEIQKSSTVKEDIQVGKDQKISLAPLSLAKESKAADKTIEITKASDSDNSETKNIQNQSQDPNQNQNQSGSNRDTNEDNSSSNNQNNQSGGDSRKPNKRDRSPPSPGAIKLPGFFDPPPPTKYETSIEVHVKKEKYPDPPPKITRKVVVKNEELEKKTEEFLRGELPYEKEDYSLGAAQRKIKNLKHNLGKTGDTIKFAEDTVSKARIGDFQKIKTPGTVVGERKKEAVFEYQYTVEDPKTGLCITTSEAVDFEEAEEELQRLAEMDAEHKITKRVEGRFHLNE